MSSENKAQQSVAVVVPYGRAFDGARLLLSSLADRTSFRGPVILLSSVPIDQDVMKLREVYSFLEAVVIPEGDAEPRLYKYLRQTEFDVVLITHTDVEIIDFDPVTEAFKLAAELPDNVAMIGVLREGFVSDLERMTIYRPTLSSHFLVVNCAAFRLSFPDGAEVAPPSLMPQLNGAQIDIFPTEYFARALAYGFICLSLPSAIVCKTLHYNSATRRQKAVVKTHPLLSREGVRDFQVDFDSLILSRRAEVAALRPRRTRPHVIWGVGDDATEAARNLRGHGVHVIGFVERFSTLWDSELEKAPVMRPSALADVPDAFIVVATPDYVNVASLLLYAGYRYLDDFAISMRRGHSFHAPEHRSLFPLEERYLSIARGGLVRSDMALADAGLDGGLSPTSLFRYGFAVFAVSWRRSVLAGWLGKHVAKLQRKIRALRQK